jgi:hypothetical protein
VESIKSRNDDGSQNVDYYKAYYAKNKDVIAAKNKARHSAKIATIEGLEYHRARSKEHVIAYRTRNSDKVPAQRRKAYTNRKVKAMAKIGEIICSNCGCNELDFLEFNHKQGNGCKEFKNDKTPMMDKILTHGRSTDDLNILCRVCNALDYLMRKNIDESKRFTISWN